MHVEDIELFFTLKVLGAFVGACLYVGGWAGKDGWTLYRRQRLFSRLFSLLGGAKRDFHAHCPWWVLSYYSCITRAW